MMLVPAVMHLLREGNWWAPGFIKRAYEKMGHSEELPPVPAPAPTPGTPEPEGELLLDDAVVVDHDEAARGGRTTSEDEELISFAELMARLEADRNGPRQLGR
jgi:RND superfamily putative drug exporter